MKHSVVFILSFLLLQCTAQSSEIVLKESYSELKASVENKRLEYYTLYENSDFQLRDSIISDVHNYLLNMITTDFFNHWYGTEWDFNGTTEIPRKGKIACGYFITTVLRDAGFHIPRVYWAQQASEYYIKCMTSDIKRYSNTSIDIVEAYFAERENGLYIVGLDNHVGFVFKQEDQLQFVHASYYDPKKGVQSEDLSSNNPLANSNYRVIGRILDKEMVRKWILGEEWTK